MPEIRTVNVKAREIRKGDVVQHGEVTGVDVKDKYTYVSRAYSNGVALKPLRLENDAVVLARRSFQTDEEKAVERKAFQTRRVERWLEGAEAGVEVAWAKIDEHRAKGWGLQCEALEGMVTAQQFAGYAEQVRRMMANAEDKGLEGVDLVTCVQHLVNKAAARLIENYDAPTYSGGFSYSNAERQAVQEAARKFIYDFRWVGITPNMTEVDL